MGRISRIFRPWRPPEPELEAGAQLGDRLALGLKNDVHEMSGAFATAGIPCKGLLFELLDGLDLATHGGDLRRQLVDDFLDAFFLAGEI